MHQGAVCAGIGRGPVFGRPMALSLWQAILGSRNNGTPSALLGTRTQYTRGGERLGADPTSTRNNWWAPLMKPWSTGLQWPDNNRELENRLGIMHSVDPCAFLVVDGLSSSARNPNTVRNPSGTELQRFIFVFKQNGDWQLAAVDS